MSRAETKTSSNRYEHVKKMPLELTRFEGELEEFTHKAMLEPLSSSFFAALGLGLLETLVRMKAKSFLTESAWKGIIEKYSLIGELAKDLRMTEVYEDFKGFLKDLRKVDRKSAWKMLEMASGFSPSQIHLEQGVKLLVCACIDQDYKLIMNGTLNKNLILLEFTKKISVHIVHIENNAYTLYKHKNIAPVIYIYSKNSHFGIVYHMSIKYLDEKSDAFGIDFRSFPFLYNPSKRFALQISTQKDSSTSEFIECLSILAYHVKPMDASSKAELFSHISSLKNLCPEAESALQEVFEQAISKCGHQGKEYTAVCLQSHCIDCLVNTILECKSDNVLCPCGIALDISDLQFLTSDNMSKQKIEHKTSSLSPMRQDNSKLLSRKSSIRKRKSSISNKLQKLPIITNKVTCSMCKKQLEKDKFSSIKCTGHQICIECRSKKLKNGPERCTICHRFYTSHELTVLQMFENSIDLTSSLLKTGDFIDNL